MAAKQTKFERRVSALSRAGRALFAAGSAERVVEFFRLYDSEKGTNGYATLRGVLDSIWRSPAGPGDDAAATAAVQSVRALIPHVDFDEAEHANIANVVGVGVLCAVQAWASGSAEDAVGAAEQVDEFVEHQFGGSDLANYHAEFDKLVGLPPAEIIARVQALNNRRTGNPARKKAEKAEKEARERLLKALESSGARADVDPTELLALARMGRLSPP